MAIFDIGIKILLTLTSFFFFVFAFICRVWTRPKHPERCTIIAIFVSGLYSFWLLFFGTLLLIIIYLISSLIRV